MIRLGQTPEFGIENAQTGLFISNFEFTPSCETYEQLDHTGEICGIALRKQKVEFQLEGEVPNGGDFSFGMGGTLTLANECPASIWFGGVAPTSTTQVVTGAPYKRDREGAATATVSGTIYPFASTSGGGGGDGDGDGDEN